MAAEIKKRLPKHQLIYFGDTAHLPYGDKSEAAIQAYSVRIADFLLKKGCHTIVIACHSASSAAYELLNEYLKGKARVINIIDPVVKFIQQNNRYTEVGLIGTQRTISSNIYAKKFSYSVIKLNSLATPLLAPMVEAGFYQKSVSQQIVQEYLTYPPFKTIDSLVMGCTHYSLISEQIALALPGKVKLIDPGKLVADEVKQILPNSVDIKMEDQFYVSDITSSFEASTRIFFGEKITLELINLWD